MSRQHRLTRRGFLRGAAAAAAAPYVITSNALGGAGRAPAGSRVVMGTIGTGGRGSGVTGSFMGMGDVQVVAVCDVDAGRLARARAGVDARYARGTRSGTARGCRAYGDFRELLARDDIDAVYIATPDHWHALASIHAARAGKDMYCEKPMAATIAEGRGMCDAIRRYGRILQVGSQERSGQGGRFACELVRNGRIGRLHTIRTNLPAARNEIGPQPPMPVPPGFDYDTWLGPAPWAPYTPRRCHGVFRWIRDYSDGELTDRGGHVNDIALWGAEPWLQGPIEIEGRGTFPRDGLWNTAYAYHIEYRYANGLRLITTSEGARGIRFEGTDGWIFCHIHGGRLEAEPESILRSTLGPNDVQLHRSVGGHGRDFIDSVKNRTDPVAPVEGGHRTASICHLGNIAMLLGRKITWDPVRERFLNDDGADAMISRPMRQPWRI